MSHQESCQEQVADATAGRKQITYLLQHIQLTVMLCFLRVLLWLRQGSLGPQSMWTAVFRCTKAMQITCHKVLSIRYITYLLLTKFPNCSFGSVSTTLLYVWRKKGKTFPKLKKVFPQFLAPPPLSSSRVESMLN